MEDNRIGAHQLSVSSSYNQNYKADRGRLNNAASHWASLHIDSNQWYEVDFMTTVRLQEIHTQGAPGFDQWVKQYTVSYGYHPDRIDSLVYEQNGGTKVKPQNRK